MTFSRTTCIAALLACACLAGQGNALAQDTGVRRTTEAGAPGLTLPPQLPPIALPKASLPALPLAVPEAASPAPGGTGQSGRQTFLSRGEIEQRRLRCAVTIRQTNLNFAAEGGMQTARFEGGQSDGCITAAAVDAPWADARIAGMGEVVITVEPNPGLGYRFTLLTVVTPQRTFVIRLAQAASTQSKAAGKQDLTHPSREANESH